MASSKKPRPSDRVRAEVADFPHGRVPRELRLRQVLTVAFELFAERGFNNASMDELARRVGVSKPVIYDLVGSKDDLFAAVLSQQTSTLAASVEAAVSAELDRDQKLYAGALAFFRYVEERRAAWRTVLTPEAAPVSVAVAAARRSQADLIAKLLLTTIAEEGIAADPVLAAACAHAINGAFESLAMFSTEHPELGAEALALLVTGLVQPGLLSFIEQLRPPA